MCHFSFHSFSLRYLSSLNDFDISSTISSSQKNIYIFSLISLLCLFIPHMPLTLRSTLSHCFSFSSCFSRTDTITDYCMHSVSGDGERDLLSFFIMSIGWKWWALWILWTQFCFIYFFSPTCSPKHTWFQSYFSTLLLVRSHKI